MNKIKNTNLTILICLLLIAAVGVVYWQLHNHDFISYDDNKYVTENQHVQNGLMRKSFRWAFTSLHGGISYWHPLTWLSHMLDCQLFDLNPRFHHLTNLWLHMANALLLLAVLKQMTGKVWQSAFVAAAFALHPLHVESAAWIAERKDVLSTFFLILTIGAYAHYVKARSATWYIAMLLAFVLALMSKPMVVTLPFVLLLLDYWPLERFGKIRTPRLIVEKVPLFTLSAALCAITITAQKAIGTVADTELIGLNFRIGNAFVAYAKYIGKMFWPSKLAVLYPHPGHDLLMWQVVASALLLIVISLWINRQGHGHKYLVTGWLWFLGTLVPVIGIVQVGPQQMADRYSYMTLTGLFIIIAWGADELLGKNRYRKVLLSSSAIIAVLALAVCARLQLRHWRNSITVYEHALKVTHNNSAMHNNLATALEAQGSLSKAISNYRQSLLIRPNHAKTHNNLGNALRMQGNLAEAITHFHIALEIEPDFAEANNNLGNQLLTQGKFYEAISRFKKALKAKPDFAEAHNNLGNALLSQGNFAEAIIHFRKALEINPDSAKVHNNLGYLLRSQDKLDEAAGHFRRALALQPDYVSALNGLAWILAMHPEENLRDVNQAISLAEHAAKLTGHKNAKVLDTLAAVYAAAGDFGRAVKIANKALELALSEQNYKLADYIRDRLKFYKQQKSFQEALQ